MKKVLVLFLLVAVFILMPVNSQPVSAYTAAEECEIIVTGTSQVFIMPNEAELFFGVRTTDDSPSHAAELNANLIKEVYQTLEEMGIEKNNISTSSYNIYPNYIYDGFTSSTKGYVVQNDLKVKIENLDDVGRVIDNLTKAGINSFNGIQFNASNKNDFYEEALREAINVANKKASVIADQFGKQTKLTKVVVDDYGYMAPYCKENFISTHSIRSYASTVISPNEICVSATVRCEFEIA